MSRIDSITTQRLDIALRQPITMSTGTVSRQNILLVRLRDTDGAEGVGEALVMGGPYWGQETIEGVRAVVERHLAPLLIGQSTSSVGAISRQLPRWVRGNAAARSAVEMAMLDLVGHRSGLPVSALLGGAVRSRIPVAWTLSTGSVETDIAEGERAAAAHGFTRFKLKFGHEAPRADVSRAHAIARHFAGRATIIADVNQGWDEQTAIQMLPRLVDAGLEALEQPLPAHALAAAAELQRRFGLRFIADEAVDGPASVLRLAQAKAAAALSLKPNRDGGLIATRDAAIIAAAAGIQLYGGSMLETSLGTAANLHCYATAPDLSLGCELFGPMRLGEDIATTPVSIEQGHLTLEDTLPGLGVSLDEEKIAFLAARSG